MEKCGQHRVCASSLESLEVCSQYSVGCKPYIRPGHPTNKSQIAISPSTYVNSKYCPMPPTSIPNDERSPQRRHRRPWIHGRNHASERRIKLRNDHRDPIHDARPRIRPREPNRPTELPLHGHLHDHHLSRRMIVLITIIVGKSGIIAVVAHHVSTIIHAFPAGLGDAVSKATPRPLPLFFYIESTLPLHPSVIPINPLNSKIPHPRFTNSSSLPIGLSVIITEN